MNWDYVEGTWKQVKGQFKEKWGKLTDDDLDVVAGKKDQLAGKLQKEYGLTKEQAESDLDSFVGTIGQDSKVNGSDTLDDSPPSRTSL